MNNVPQQPTNFQQHPTMPMLSKEKVSQLYQKLEQMKKLGQEKDPNFERYKAIFKMQIQLHQNHKKQQELQLQQQQQTQSPIQQHYQIPQVPEIPYIQQQQQMNPQLVQQFQGTSGSSAFSKSQLDQLKAQIYCLRYHLLKNIPIPSCLLQAIKGVNTESSLHEYELMYRTNSYKMPTQQPQTNINGQLPPVSKLPNGLDLHALVTEREKRVKVRMKRKFDELKTQINSGKLTEQEKTNSFIQIKAIQLLNNQKILRQKVFGEYKELENIKNNIRKSKRLLDKKTIDPYEKTRRKTFKRVELDPEFNQRDKFKRLVADIGNQRKKHIKYHQEVQKTMEKLIKELKVFFEKKAKLEKEKKEKAERARLKALKENDSEAYYKLLVSAKEDRLLELIKQTDNCLKSLGAQLVNERMKEEGENKVEDNKTEEKGVVERYLENEKAYYTVAHRYSEIIEKQPTKLAGGDLKEYQIFGLQWLVSLYNNKLNGILADEMGLGKTVQTVALLTYLMEFKGNQGPHLVIVPLSTIENWRLEFQKWAPHINLVKYGGGPAQRKSIQNNELKEKKFNVLLVQYEYITRDKKFLKKVPWNYIIIDEGHRIKNKDCILVRDLKQYKSEHRLLLTGTPLQNDLKELWALLNFLLPKIFDNSTNFETWFNTPFQGMGVTDKEMMQMTEEETLLIIHRLHQVLRPFLLRREKKDVEHQLPEKVEKIIRCSLSAMQKTLYEQIQNKNSIGKLKQKTLNNSVMQLRKVCNHPYLFFDDWSGFARDDIIRCSGKFELLNRMLPKMKAGNHKVLIFSQMTNLLDILGYYLEMQGHKFLRLDGNVKAENRGNLVKDFNAKNSEYFVFLLSTRAGGLGLNLQSADTVIIFDSDWNPQQDLQAMARAHRIGQTRAVRVFILVSASPVEEKIFDRAQEKRNAEAKVIKAGMFDQKSTHHQRQDMLETILMKNDDSYDTEIPSDTQLNQILARGDKEFELFEKMDKELEEKEELYCQENNIPRKSRLTTEEEVPLWLKEKAKTETEDEELIYGRGLRNKKIMNYEIEPKKEEEPVVELKPIVQETSKRKRKETVKETKKRNKKKKKEELNELEKELENIWNVLTTLTDPKDERDISYLFLDLPSKEYYPDYYQIIQSPICFNQIHEKIYRGEYETLLDFEKDIQLLCTNAQTFNLETSMVYQDSLVIMSTFQKEKSRLLEPKKPQKLDMDFQEEEEEKFEDEEEEIETIQEGSDFDEKSNSGNEKSNDFLSGDENSGNENNSNSGYDPEGSNSGFDSNLYTNNGFDPNGDSGFVMW